MNRLSQQILLTISLATVLSASALTFGPKNDVSNNADVINDIALVINNDAISRSQLQKEREAARKALPKDINVSESQLSKILNEQVIIQHLINQLTKKASSNIKEANINNTIQTIAQQNNLSVSQLYQKVKQQTGMEKAEYRSNVIKQLVQNQLKQLVVGNSVQISQSQIDSQIAQIARQRQSTIHLQDLLIPIPSGEPEQRAPAYQEIMTKIAASLKSNPDDLQAISTQIPGARFSDLGNVNIAQIPTRFAQAVANLSAGNVLDIPIVDNDGMHFLKVASKTDGQGKGYVIPQAKVKQILIRENSNNPGAAKRIINIIYAELKKGGNFSSIAKEYSQDPNSAVRGGDLGWVNSDEVDPLFAKAMINTPLNTLSKPFKSSFGWHIIEVENRRDIDRTEDRLRSQIRNALYQDALEKAWQQKLAEVRHAAYISFR